MRTVLHDFDEELVEPLVLASNTELRGARVRLGPSFANGWQQPAGKDNRGEFGVVRVKPGAENVIVENSRIEGPPEDWWNAKLADQQGFIWAHAARGIQVVETTGVVLSNVRVSSFPAEGIYTHDNHNLSILDCRVERCNAGLAIEWPRGRGNQGILVDGLDVTDTWAVAGRNAIGKSILRPGGMVGANFMHGAGLVRSTIRRVRCTGEGKGIKFYQCAGLELVDLRTPHLWLGGAYATPVTPTWKGPLQANGYSVHDSVIGESTFGFSVEKSSDPITLQTSMLIDDELLVERCVLLTPRPGPLFAPWQPPTGVTGWRFQVVQATGGMRVRLRDCRMIDLNPTGTEPTWGYADAASAIVEERVTRETIRPQWQAP